MKDKPARLVRIDVNAELYQRVRGLAERHPDKAIVPYRDEFGDHFRIRICRCCMTIRWYSPNSKKGERWGSLVSNSPYRNLDRDMDVAVGVTRAFFKAHRLPLPTEERPFIFADKNTAAKCLQFIHAALHYRRHTLREPTPEWAKQASSAGWLPPKGWRA